MEVYQKFIIENPDIRLRLRTEYSFEMYPLIENQQIDLGFAFTLHKSPNVVATALYREIMVILYEKDHVFSQTHRLDDLKPEYEIYQTFGSSYDMWHQRRFPRARTRIVFIGSMSMLPKFIRLPGAWMILPRSMADIMVRSNPKLSMICLQMTRRQVILLIFCGIVIRSRGF